MSGIQWRAAGRRTSMMAAVAMLAGGCASVPPGERSKADPWESFNRPVFAFNDAVDRAAVKPVAQFYANHVHEGFRGLISNFFDNLLEPWTVVNQLLQGKPLLAFNDASRFVINSTVGILGFTNLAGELGLERHREDFGQTLGVWGLGPGPYLVLPILGPSDARDAVGLVPDYYYYTRFLGQLDDSTAEWTLTGVNFISLRAQLLPAEKVLEGAALDKYSFIRDGYLARRRNLVYDGNPPEEPDDDEGAPNGQSSADGQSSAPGATK